MKNKYLTIYAFTVLIIILLGGIWVLKPIRNEVDLSNNSYYIAHAAGEINGLRYTNSKELKFRK